eukprot:4450793-Ditylum_brightwellii.AAC.1
MSACTANKDNEVKSSRGRRGRERDNAFMSFDTASFGGTSYDTRDTDYRTYDDTETNYTSAVDAKASSKYLSNNHKSDWDHRIVIARSEG